MAKPFGELGDITIVYSQMKGFFEKSTTSCCTAARSCTKSQNRQKSPKMSDLPDPPSISESDGGIN